MKRISTIIAASTLALGLGACGAEDLGGYADQNEACSALGGKIVQGPIREADEEEYVCDVKGVGRVVETKYFGENRDKAENTWFVDEDTEINLEDGSERCRGEECTNSGEADSQGYYQYEEDGD